MSFHINSDKEKIRGVNPKLIGDNEATIRVGTGTDEREVFRAQLDPNTNLPRIGINRTGQRVNNIEITEAGSGYTQIPLVTLSAPPAGGTQALASAFIFNGRISSIAVNDPGSGYTSPPTVTITGGNGAGAAAQAFLDTVDFELDINGAIRTSTSIISDTARVLNLDIENFVTPDLALRGPSLKTYMNGTGTIWSANVILQKGDYRYFGTNVYEALNSGQTGTTGPEHTDGIALNGEVRFNHIGFRVIDPNNDLYLETGEAGLFPRSITPQLGDRSTKIATTEYVLNLATNDVGGRIYVSEQIGSDLNDGRSAVNPVRTIKKAAQLAWATPGIKETIIVSGGDYVEDNPISLPPDASVVGDNLRLVIIRPANPNKHIFKFGDKNYVTGVTYRDQVDSNGDPVATWDFAMVFDDKQRIIIDNEANGDFGVDFPIGHQIFGPNRFRVAFQNNTGLSNLQNGIEVIGVNTGSRANIIDTVFNSTTGNNAYVSGTIDVEITSGSFVEGEQYNYITSSTTGSAIALSISATSGNNTLRFVDDPTSTIPVGTYVFLDDTADTNFTDGYYQVASIDDANAPTYWDVNFIPILGASGWDTSQTASITINEASPVIETFDTTSLRSIRAEGEVVSFDEDITSTLPITRLDFSLQGDPSIATGGFQEAQFGSAEDLGGVVFYTNDLVGRSNTHELKEGQEILIEGLPTANPDLSALNGKQRIYKVLEDADGRARRFVIPKKFPAIATADLDPGEFATVKSYSKVVTLSLLNSPNKFQISTPTDRRYQDACQLIRNNRDFIADEVVGKINDQFKKEYYSAYNIDTVNNTFDVFLGTSNYQHTYVSGGTVYFGLSSYTITNFVWDNISTGVATITLSTSPGFVEDDIIRLEDILVSCSNGQKLYPSFSIPVDDEQCRQDIVHFLNALVRDLEFGSNHNILEAGSKYIVGAKIGYVDNEIIQTVRAIEYARELAIYAMCNWRTGNRTPGDPIYVPQYSTLTRYFDDTVITTTAGTPACANVASAITTLSYLFVDVVANNSSGTYLDAAYLIARNKDLIAHQALLDTQSQYPSLGLSNTHERKCLRDIGYVLKGLIRDICLGGNAGTVTAAKAYFTANVLSGVDASQIAETRYAYTRVRDYAIAAMRNWTDGTGNVINTTSDIPQFTDGTILADPASPDCANVSTTIGTLMGILDGILEYGEDDTSPTATAPSSVTLTYGTLYDISEIITYPDSYIYDFNNQRVAIRGDFDEYPIIEASPYTQNASVISFLGGGGALIDGAKVKQPNCPFPGLELDGTATFPNQGKSMVAAAFTIVSFGGTGYRIINDGYVQLVSVFVIFCADGVLSESGGYASITNSATNFGQFALRAKGYRAESYDFDVATVDVVSQTATGRTTLTISGLGREPLEHYVAKFDGYSNFDDETEYFIDAVSAVTVGPPFSATITLDDGTGTALELIRDSDGAVITGLTNLQNALTPQGQNATIRLHRPSIVNSSSHTWEFAGSGTNYLALPENGGTKIEANEQVSQDYGRVYCSGTDELGDFKVGTFARIENRTGNITFTGTVTISEVEFLKLKGGDVVVTGFDASNTLGGANATDSKLPTQKAVRDYITNNLGPYINKPYSTNAVPRALVELTDSGKISVDQIPALRPFSVYTVADQAERLAIEGALAGDIAIQQDTSQSFILNNDLDSLFIGFAVDPTLQFTTQTVYTGTPSTGRIQATEYREGVVYQINITNGGSGYTVAPTVTISGGNPDPGGAVPATATCTIANGEVVTVTITENAGYKGGYGYTSQPTVTFAAPPGAGTQATGNALLESRLYGDIVNRIKILDTDTFDDDLGATINITRVVNTSGNNNSNWVSLSTNQIAASDITSGVIETDRLASGGTANSFTFLRGDQNWAIAVQSIKGAESRYFAQLYSVATVGSSQLIFTTNSNTLIGHTVVPNVAGIANDTSINGVITAGGLTTVSINNPLTAEIAAGTIIEFQRGSSPLVFESSQTQGGFVDQVVVANSGTGYTDGQYFDIGLDGGAGTGLRGNIIVSGGGVTEVTVTSSGSGYTSDFTITPNPVDIGTGSNLVLLGKISTVNRQYANVSLDIQRVSDLTISADAYGTIGVARFKKSQFNLGQAGNGSVEIITGPDSGLDADLLDGAQGAYYTNASNISSGTLDSDRLSGTYNISISGQSANTIRLLTGTSNPSSNPLPKDFAQGIVANSVFNSSNGLSTAYPSVTGIDPNDPNSVPTSTKHLVMTVRTEGNGISTASGVRQLAFADDNNIYTRGSGSEAGQTTTFGSWNKIWSSGNHGIESGLDADKLDNKQGLWYQDGWNIKTNQLFDTRLPRWISSSKFRNQIEIKSYSGTDTYYRILVRESLDIDPGGDYEPNSQINVYDAAFQDISDFFITDAFRNVDVNDPTNTYTMLIGRLPSGGDITLARYIGFAGEEKVFENYEIYDTNTYTTAKLGNDSGSGFLQLGRRDGVASSNPYIWFNSSQAPALDGNGAATYNAAIVASGGNATEGSGTLEFLVANENAVEINGSVIWNASNVVFNNTNVATTYLADGVTPSLRSAVMRDGSGNFSAGTITANLTGAASLNVLKTGDTMTGTLVITGIAEGTQALSVSGRTDLLASATVEDDLTVDAGTLYVDSTNNKVTIGSTTSGRGRLNISDSNGSVAYQSGTSLGAQSSQYKFAIWNSSNGGESGLILQHGSSTNEAEWGISTLRSANYVGSLVFRTRTAASTNATRLTITNSGDLLPGTGSDQDLGSTSLRWQVVNADIYFAKDSIRIGDASTNAEADIQFKGAGASPGGGRNFRIGNNIGAGVDVFAVYSSGTDGGVDWKNTLGTPLAPAIAVQGSTNRVAINTTDFSGVDTSTDPNTTRYYSLNVQGDVNFNGQLFQNNEEFVTSRWTESPNTLNIYRPSFVGINFVQTGSKEPAFPLEVFGGSNILGYSATANQNTHVLYANGDKQWIDTYGVVKSNRNSISENLTITSTLNCMSIGPITINNGYTVTIASGAVWTII